MGAHKGQYLCLKPWVFVQPDIISRAGMGQGDLPGPVLLPVFHQFGDSQIAFAKMEVMGIFSNH